MVCYQVDRVTARQALDASAYVLRYDFEA